MLREIPLQDMLLLAAPKALPRLRIFKRVVAAVKVDGRFMRFSVKGQCDIWGSWRGGRHVELELKAHRGRLSPEQEAWRDFCLSWEISWLLLQQVRGEAAEETVARWLREIAETAG